MKRWNQSISNPRGDNTVCLLSRCFCCMRRKWILYVKTVAEISKNESTESDELNIICESFSFAFNKSHNLRILPTYSNENKYVWPINTWILGYCYWNFKLKI